MGPVTAGHLLAAETASSWYGYPAMTEQRVLRIATRGRGLFDITAQVNRVIAESGIHTGLCVVFVRHTSASLVIEENADPSVQRDLTRWMNDLAPESRKWEHDDEG